MTLLPPGGFQWPLGWELISSEANCLETGHNTAEIVKNHPRSISLTNELNREVSPSHPLYGVDCQAIAINRQDSDDILFLTSHPEMPLAYVHLTWNKEDSSTFPFTKGYLSCEAFRRDWLEETAE